MDNTETEREQEEIRIVKSCWRILTKILDQRRLSGLPREAYEQRVARFKACATGVLYKRRAPKE
jgi:hypothetical protein